MNRRITIHEYESVSESELGDNFASLEKLVMANRGGGTDPLELLSLSVRRSVGKVATARNHVGVITFSDGVELEILPKIGSAMDCDDPDGASRMIFLRMLRTVFDLPFKEFDVATVNSKRMSVFEFFISMFVRETEKLLKNGLSSSYYEVRGNEPFLKGRVDFSENLKRNAVHRERFFVEYQTYGTDRPENRLVRSTLDRLYSASRHSGNRRRITSLLCQMDRIPCSADVDGDFSKVCIDRNMTGYRRIMRWCEVFLKNRSFTTFSGPGVASSFLFPMDRLYEAYVAKVLEGDLHGKVTVRTQRSEHLFDNSRRFRLRPDIVVETGGKRIIIDTKWKLLYSDRDISESDMYQMFVYSRRLNAEKTVLLYPKSSMDEASFLDLKDEVRVEVCFVDMIDSRGSLKTFGRRLMEELDL